jgi:2-oxoisovalerate dehydrogenase E2 component (dihydrolipoyl transacylase)
VQSDKASVEITSRFAGVVKKLYYDAGEVARVGKPFVDIDVKEEEEEGDGGSQGASASESAAATPEVQAESSMPDPRAPKELVQPELESAQTPPPPPQQQQQHQHQQRPKGKAAHISTPAVRYLAQQHGVDIAEIDGTGKDGRVTKEDLQKFVRERPSSSSSSASSLSTSQPQQSQQQPPPPPSSSPKAPSEQQETVHKMTNTQAQMFKTMTRSLAIPHFLYSDEVDFSALHELRVRLNRALAQSPPVAAPSVAKLTYLPFLIKAVSMALHQYPILNARVDTSTPTPSIILRSAHNVGVAMDTPSGLVVPVVRDVAARSVLDIAAELARLQALALAGKLGLRDLSGGTITVSNIGGIGGTYLSPVIVDREVAILGVGRVRTVPAFASAAPGAAAAAVDGQDDLRIVRKQVCNFSWSADHRVVDGATMARASEVMRRVVEQPDMMMLQLR